MFVVLFSTWNKSKIKSNNLFLTFYPPQLFQWTPASVPGQLSPGLASVELAPAAGPTMGTRWRCGHCRFLCGVHGHGHLCIVVRLLWQLRQSAAQEGQEWRVVIITNKMNMCKQTLFFLSRRATFVSNVCVCGFRCIMPPLPQGNGALSHTVCLWLVYILYAHSVHLC